MTEGMRNREIELMTYLRNVVTDPNGRSTSQTDTFTSSTSATKTLSQTGVKNVVSVTKNGTPLYIGYNYTVNYGEGSAVTTVVLNDAPIITDSVVIVYKYGQAMIYEGFQRLDSELPRMAVIQVSASPVPMSIGEQLSGTGNYIYYNSTYIIEVRSRYANQLKTMMEDVVLKLHSYRQLTPQPYLTITLDVNSKNSLDFDNDLRLYRGQISFTARWIVKFKD